MNSAEPEPEPERYVFPFAADRAVIRWFLKGRKEFTVVDANHETGDVSASLFLEDHKLFLLGIGIAHYDPATGSLLALLPSGRAMHGARRVFEFISRELGAGIKFTREDNGNWFYGGQLLKPGHPFVVAGPLGVLAYRTQVACCNVYNSNK